MLCCAVAKSFVQYQQACQHQHKRLATAQLLTTTQGSFVASPVPSHTFGSYAALAN
jgi:hypothetical protein